MFCDDLGVGMVGGGGRGELQEGADICILIADWCFWIVVLEKTLRVPWTARRSNQLIIQEINPEYLLEGLILKLKFQYFSHLMQRADSLEETLMLGKTEGRRQRRRQRMDGWMASLTQWTWVWANARRQWRTGKPCILQSMGLQTVEHDWETQQQQRRGWAVPWRDASA